MGTLVSSPDHHFFSLSENDGLDTRMREFWREWVQDSIITLWNGDINVQFQVEWNGDINVQFQVEWNGDINVQVYQLEHTILRSSVSLALHEVMDVQLLPQLLHQLNGARHLDNARESLTHTHQL